MARSPNRFDVFPKPFQSHVRKRGLPGWIEALMRGYPPGLGLSQLVALGPGLAQGHGGILPQSQLPPCTTLGVAQAPEPLASRHNLQRQGIGKFTFILQIALNMKDKKILYVSGKENINQLDGRAHV